MGACDFTAWCQHSRMLQSLVMLAAGLPATGVALDPGYATSSVFIEVLGRTLANASRPSAASLCRLALLGERLLFRFYSLGLR